jgi:hypothetical protein
MKKIKQLLLSVMLASVLMSCNQKRNLTHYYPSEEIITDSSSVIFDLETITMNFGEFINKCDELEEHEKQTVITFLDGDTLKKVKIHVIGNGLFYQRNILNIINDSIQMEINYPLDDLEKIMEKHYFNNGKIEEYADSPEKAIIKITLKNDENVNTLKKYLIAYTRALNSINRKNKSAMNLPVFIGISVPPPPPINPNVIDK